MRLAPLAVLVALLASPGLARATGTVASAGDAVDVTAVRTVVALEGATATRWTEVALVAPARARALVLVAAAKTAEADVVNALVPEALDAASSPTVVPAAGSARQARAEASPFPPGPPAVARGAAPITRMLTRADVLGLAASAGVALAPATLRAAEEALSEGLVLVGLPLDVPAGASRAPVLRVRDDLGARVPAGLVGGDRRAVPFTLLVVDTGRAAPTPHAAIDPAAIGFATCATESTWAAHRTGLLLDAAGGAVLELASRAPFAGPAPTFSSLATAWLHPACALDAPSSSCTELERGERDDALRVLAAGGPSAVLTRTTALVPLGARATATTLARTPEATGPERTWTARFDGCHAATGATGAPATPYVLPGSGGAAPPRAAAVVDDDGGEEAAVDDGCGTGRAVAAGAIDVLATAIAEGSDDDGDGDGWGGGESDGQGGGSESSSGGGEDDDGSDDGDESDDQSWEADDDDGEEARLEPSRARGQRGPQRAPNPVSRAALFVTALALPLRRLFSRGAGRSRGPSR